MVAVTGTNGKTSVASFTRQIWEALGETAVNFGTVGVEGAVSAKLTHTTPEPITLHRLLADLADKGVTHAAMEASCTASTSSASTASGSPPPASPTSPATTSTTTRTSRPTSRPSSASSSACCRSAAPPSSTSTTRTARASAASPGPAASGCITIGRADGCDLRLLGQRFDADGQELLFAWGGKTHKVRLDLIGGFQARERAGLRRPRHRLRQRPRRGHRRAARPPHRARPHGARRPPRRTARWSSSTTPTPPTRSPPR